MAKVNNKKKKISFFSVVVIYAIFGIFLVTCVFRSPISDVLKAYEDTRTESFMNEYIKTFDRERAERIAGNNGFEYDANVFTEKDVIDIFANAYDSSSQLEYKRNGALCTDARTAYYVLDNNKKIGTVVIEQENQPTMNDWFLHNAISGALSKVFGCSFGQWNIVSENYNLDNIKKETLEIKVPENWTVQWNGYTLDESYITGTKERIESIMQYYDYYEIPKLVTYSVTSYPGYISLQAFDPDGNPVTLGTNSQNQELFVKEYEDDGNEEIIAAVDEFMVRYIRYCSGANKNRGGNLDSLRYYMVPGSDLEERMNLAYEGQYFASSHGDSIISQKYNRILHIGDHWLADITYELSTIGNNGEVNTEHNAIVFMTDYNGSLRADSFINY